METEEMVSEETQQQPRGFRHRGDHGAAAGAGGGSSSITLGPRDVLIGKLTVDGDIRVQGTIEGELSATGDVSVESQGTVKAPVEARNVSVRGNLTGDVNAREKLVVAGSGIVSGNVKISRLAIEDGATLNGNVSMQNQGGGGTRTGEGGTEQA